MKHADKTYGEFADMFMNDELSPFLERRIRNPESLFRKAVSDEGTYRALRDALKKNPTLIHKLEREIVDSRMNKYYKKPNLIGSKEFNQDIRELEGLIGKPKTNKVKNSLTKQKNILNKERVAFDKKVESYEKKKEISKIAREKIKQSTNIKNASAVLKKSPEEIIHMMDSRSGIRELKQKLESMGKKELFNRLAEQKSLEILRGGNVLPKNIKGSDILEKVGKGKNYEIMSELHGKERVNQLLTKLSKWENRIMNIEAWKELGFALARIGVGGKLIKILRAVPT
jgi:hypothetical protein